MKTYSEELGPNLQDLGLDFLFVYSLSREQTKQKKLHVLLSIYSLTALIFTTLVSAGHHNFAMSEFTALDEKTFT